MRVKRFEGKNEEKLKEQIREEMGEDATIVSTRSKPYAPPLGWFLKPKTVITVAYEDDDTFTQGVGEASLSTSSILETARAIMPPEGKKDEESIEDSFQLLLQEARKATLKTTQEEEKKPESKPAAKKRADEKTEESPGQFENPLVQTVYDTLISQDVLPEVAVHLLGDLTQAAKTDVRDIVKTVYGNIIALLSNPTLIDPKKPGLQTVVFMGPTGVGKTTTIAKLASLLALQHDLRVGLVTADTYRIAAVEQLRTYADILGLEIRTVYKPDEMAAQVATLTPNHDFLLIDTAGRSHRNKENLEELRLILDEIPNSVRYLVVSVATRYRDLASIVKTYGSITDFDLIFTKLDEADSLGNLANLCCLTRKKPAYITFGQDVPEDFDAIKPESIAKSLLGLTGENPYNHESGGETA